MGTTEEDLAEAISEHGGKRPQEGVGTAGAEDQFENITDAISAVDPFRLEVQEPLPDVVETVKGRVAYLFAALEGPPLTLQAHTAGAPPSLLADLEAIELHIRRANRAMNTWAAMLRGVNRAIRNAQR